ncbi:unnamed protein product [Paramecium primaurelia]|uniref:Uncharacterized protein n=1 Tax=Paramecium primaurelia TaxID=5886 RepID=A0A8S1PKQ2_PARPR|nr:unnamed protein product [Paramecium primaurelia]
MKVQSSSNDQVRPYNKVPKLKQEQLINLVYKEEWKINQAADLLNINYATAKNIVQKFKKTHILGKKVKSSESKRCHYKLISESKAQLCTVNTKWGLVSDCLIEQFQKP